MKKIMYALFLSLLVSSQVLAATFRDVPFEHKNYHAVEAMVASEVVQGYGDGSFQPDKTVNRAEMATMLVAADGVTPALELFNNCFPDVTTEWFAPYVCYAKEQGWVGGYPDGTYKPGQTVNKVEALRMILETDPTVDAELGLLMPEAGFTDIDTTAWYMGYLNIGYNIGMTEERSGAYNPGGGMSRGSVAEYIFRGRVISFMQAIFDEAGRDTYLTASGLTYIMTGDTLESTLGLEISTFMADPYYFDEEAEYIEITNAGQTSVNMSGYSLEGSSYGYEITYTFPNVTLGAGESIKVYSGSGYTYSMGLGEDIWDDNYAEVNLYDEDGNLVYYYG